MLEVTGERTVFEDRWLVVKEKRYRKEDGGEGRWTYVERTGRREAVIVVPITEDSGSLVLVRQYRVPFEREVVEFPAGLVDPGEEAEQAAARELLEETGYQGRVMEVGPEIATSAGLATETIRVVRMRVGEAPVQAPQRSDSEQIEVLKVKPEEFSSFLEECARLRLLLDAKTYVYLEGRSRH
jgi:8-oxo-dGTP pyrophosphatase MutT (NUDIX family)